MHSVGDNCCYAGSVTDSSFHPSTRGSCPCDLSPRLSACKHTNTIVWTVADILLATEPWSFGDLVLQVSITRLVFEFSVRVLPEQGFSDAGKSVRLEHA